MMYKKDNRVKQAIVIWIIGDMNVWRIDDMNIEILIIWTCRRLWIYDIL